MRRGLLLAAVLLAAALYPGAARAADGDGDGMPDRWERRHGLSPTRANAGGDPDGDRLDNIDEYLNSGDPQDEDTDGDGLLDGKEVRKWGTEVDVPDAVVGRASAIVCRIDGGDCAQRGLGGIALTLADAYGVGVEAFSASEGTFHFHVPRGTYTLTSAAPGFTPADPMELRVRSQVVVAKIRLGTGGRGLVGRVTQSPTCGGPQRPGEECVEPLDGAPLRVEDRQGALVAETTSGPSGRYYFALDPGSYTLVAGEVGDSGLPSPPGPIDFEIGSEDLTFRVADLDYDTGIR